jgi:hypothetical protein
MIGWQTLERSKASVVGPGGTTAVSYSAYAGETISALRAVYEAADGKLYHLDSSDGANIDSYSGISLTAANEGSGVSVQKNGLLIASGLGLTRGRVFCGASGVLTNTPPSTGYDLLIGYIVSGDRLVLTDQDPITLP